MGEITHSGLGVALRKRDDQGYYEFGVIVDGGFVSFGARKIGDVEPELEAAKAAQAASTGNPSDTTATGT